jgi:hypothetical protein
MTIAATGPGSLGHLVPRGLRRVESLSCSRSCSRRMRRFAIAFGRTDEAGSTGGFWHELSVLCSWSRGISAHIWPFHRQGSSETDGAPSLTCVCQDGRLLFRSASAANGLVQRSRCKSPTGHRLCVVIIWIHTNSRGVCQLTLFALIVTTSMFGHLRGGHTDLLIFNVWSSSFYRQKRPPVHVAARMPGSSEVFAERARR